MTTTISIGQDKFAALEILRSTGVEAERSTTPMKSYAEAMRPMDASEAAALEVLRSTGAGLIEAAIVAKAALAVGRGKMKRAMKCIEAGDEALRMREKTVTFERAVEVALEVRKDRRKRTVVDFRYISRRLITRCKELAKRRVRSITPMECAEYIRQAFDTPRQRNKARLILSGVFSTAVKRGWCAENPVRLVEPERIEEKRIRILSKEEIDRLMATAERYEGGACLAAVGMMLYAGIRPHECERLRWSDIRLAEGAICISPQHSKTGGARCVTIHPPLARILRHVQKLTTSAFAHPIGADCGRGCTRPQVLPGGNRMCCAILLPRIIWPPSAATQSYS